MNSEPLNEQVSCLQHRLDNEQACPYYKSDTNAELGDNSVASESLSPPLPDPSCACGDIFNKDFKGTCPNCIASDYVPRSEVADRYAEGFASGVEAAAKVANRFDCQEHNYGDYIAAEIRALLRPNAQTVEQPEAE